MNARLVWNFQYSVPLLKIKKKEFYFFYRQRLSFQTPDSNLWCPFRNSELIWDHSKLNFDTDVSINKCQYYVRSQDDQNWSQYWDQWHCSNGHSFRGQHRSGLWTIVSEGFFLVFSDWKDRLVNSHLRNTEDLYQS